MKHLKKSSSTHYDVCPYHRRYGWKTKQSDFVAAYLNEDMDVILFMEMPTGYEISEYVSLVTRAYYGFRQSGLMWNRKLDVALEMLGFKKIWYYPCLFYILKSGGKTTLLEVWMDDISSR